ncbi:MAG: hypothetical protein GTO40_28010 [Deltaproteobacteria bacterium]|nr:hypothetical protein [Deltaproteobacteria bacterium]
MTGALSRRRWAVPASQKHGRGKARRTIWGGNALAGVAVVACLVSLALAHVWLRLQVVRMGYVLSAASKLQGQLEQENRELMLELTTLTSPDRLEQMARSRLGLVEPQQGQVVVLP